MLLADIPPKGVGWQPCTVGKRVGRTLAPTWDLFGETAAAGMDLVGMVGSLLAFVLG